jgi:hypothetical protein
MHDGKRWFLSSTWMKFNGYTVTPYNMNIEYVGRDAIVDTPT